MPRLRKPKRVAVLGCGPAGLFAAHALQQRGCDVTVFSNKRRSEMFGAQYLHQPIPGLPEIGVTLRYQLIGTERDYQRKVYGDTSVEFVSPQKYVGTHQVFDIRAAYYAAWDRYQDLIEHRPDLDVAAVESLAPSFKRVFSAIPAPSICWNPSHQFSSRTAWAIGDAPERGVKCPVPCPDNTVICNGDRFTGWYRVSSIFGYSTAEWPEDRRPPIAAAAKFTKPIATNCNCFKDIIRLGRYGAWSKESLSHHAYEIARSVSL